MMDPSGDDYPLAVLDGMLNGFGWGGGTPQGCARLSALCFGLLLRTGWLGGGRAQKVQRARVLIKLRPLLHRRA
jgi:hypothetical protein